MADAESNIRIDIDATAALDTLKNLQRQISVFHQNLAASGNAANRQVSENLQRNLINNINATGKFSASLESVKSTADNFTTSLEKNKFSLGEYFRYGIASTRNFGKVFRSEFETIEKTARERVKTLQTQYIKLGRDASGAIQTIQVRPLTLDMENLATKTAMAAQKQQILNQLLKQGSTNLLNFGKNTQWAGRQLMVGFTIPLSIFATTAVKSFAEMEEAVIKFQRVYGDFGTTAAETEKMVTQVRALANEFTKYGVAVADTMNLAADVAAMGKSGAELTAQVAEATRLAVLGGVEQSQALETTISMTNAFGTAAEDLASKINFLNSVENQTVTSIEDLTIAIPKAGPVIQQLGGNVEDLAFFLTAMKEGGINASEGANALKSGLASLINPTQKASEFMRGFGINIEGIVEANKGNVKGIVVDFAQALDKLDPLNRARAIEQLFGKFQFARLSTLFKNVIEEGSQASRVLDLTRASAAELAVLSERELKRVEDSPLYKFQKALEDIQASLIPLGEEFLKLITPVIEFGTGLLKQFNSLDEGAKKFVTGLVAVIGLIAPAAIMTFGLVANGVANLIKGFGMYRTLLQKISGATAMAGGSTEYLTQEQLQAMAAASSLNQVHSTLVQTFSAEKSAVQQLTIAYRQAVAAQAAFGGMPNIRTPRKFAKGGIVYGPGTGTSDSIPAMISNGEAIVPAKQTKKYGALIAGIIADNIPGYERSNVTISGSRVVLPSQGEFDAGSPKQATELARTVDKLIEAGKLLGLSVDEAEAMVGKLATTVAEENKGKVTSAKLVEKEKQEYGGGYSLVGNRTVGVREALEKDRVVMGNEGVTLSHAGTPLPLNMEQRQKIAAQMPEGVDRQRVLDPKKGLNLYSEEVFQTPAILNAKDAGLTKGDAAEIIRSDTASFVADAAASAKLDPSSPAFADFGNRVANVLAQSASEGFTDADLTPAVRQAVSEMPDNAEKAALEGRMKTYAVVGGGKGEKRVTLPSSVDLSGADLGLDEDIQIGAGGQSYLSRRDKKSAVQKMEAHRAADESVLALASKKIDTSKLSKEGGADDAKNWKDGATQVLGDGESDPFKIATPERNSPHPESYDSGFDDGQSWARGNKDGIDSVWSSRTESSMNPDGTISSTSSDWFSSGSSYLDSISMEEAEVLDDLERKQRKRDSRTGIGGKAANFFGNMKDAMQEKAEKFAMDRLNVTGDANVLSSGKVYVPSTGQTFDSIAEHQAYIDKQNEAARLQHEAAMQMNANADKQGQAADMQVQSASAEMQSIDDTVVTRRGLRAAQKAQAADDKKAARQAAADRRQKRAGAVAGVLGTATMGLGVMSMVGGPMAEFAQSIMPVVTGLSIVAPLLMALSGPIAILVGIVGAAAAVWVQSNAVIDELRNSARETAKQFDSSAESMRKFTEISGRVTGSEVLAKQRESELSLRQIAPGKTPFGMTFMDSESGKQLLTQAQKVLESGNSDLSTLFGTQLRDAILSGALSVPEARSIVTELSSRLKDYGLGLELQAQITDLFGPNGEDLQKDGVDIRVRAIVESQTDFQSALTGPDGLFSAMSSVDPDAIATRIGLTVEKWLGFLGLGSETTDKVENQSKAVVDYVFGVSSQLSAAKQSLDQFDYTFQQQIQQAEEQGLTAKAEAMTEKWLSGRERILSAYNSVITGMQDVNLDELPYANQLLQELDKQILTKFEEGSAEYTQAKEALEQFDAKNLGAQDKTITFGIKALVRSGDLDISSLNRLMAIDDTETYNTVLKITGKLGGAAANRAIQLASLFVDSSGKPLKEVQKNFILKVSTLNTEDADAFLKTFSEISLLGYVIDVSLVMQTYVDDPKKLAELNKELAAIDELDKTKKVTVEYLQKNKVLGDTTFEALKQNQEYFESLDPVQQVTYLEVLATLTVAGEGALPSFDVWAAENTTQNPTGKVNSLGVPQFEQVVPTFDDYTNYLSELFTQINENADGDNPGGTTSSGGGAGADPFSDILNSLRRVRDASIDAKGGVDELLRVAGKGKDLTLFKGLDQQLLSRGWNQEFTSFISSLEQGSEEAKKFYKVAADGTLTLTAVGKALKNAYDQKILGDFQLTQVKTVTDINNQRIALQKLTYAGVELSDAYKLVADAALAAAIANGKISADEWKLLVEAINDATAALADFNAEQDIATQIEKLSIDAAIKAFARNTFPDLTSEMLNALLTVDEYYRKIMANLANGIAVTQEEWDNFSKWWSEVFIPGLQTDIDIKPARSPEQIFQEGFSNVMKQFSTMETEIQLKFAVDTKADNDMVKAAENRIAEIQYQIDDYEEGLRVIQNQEDEINKKYDERFKALDNISKANDDLIKQQKSQLTIADALTQGDIATAAKAVFDARQEAANQSITNQRQVLEQQKENEIANVRNELGLTREEIEKRIKDLQEEIFKIEEQQLEPAQERIRLAQIIVDAQIESLTVLGKTKSEWEGIQNEIDTAITKGNDFKAAMEEALSIIQQIRSGGITGDEITTVPTPSFPTDPNDIFDPVIDPPAEEQAPVNKLSDGREIFTYGNGRRYIKALRGENTTQLSKLISDALGKTVSADKLTPSASGGGDKDYLYANQWVWLPEGYAKGGMVGKPKYFNIGGFAKGTDTVPAMLTPGEFVVRKYAVDKFGVDNLKAINSGTYTGGSVYNSYDINVNVRTDANPDQIAKAVMMQIRQIDSQRIRGSRI